MADEKMTHDNHAIDLATLKDAQAISALTSTAIEHGLARRWTTRRVIACMADSSINMAVVRKQNTVAGFALMSCGDDQAHLLLLAVAPAHRRLGIASALLAWHEASLRVAGIAQIRLEARTQNQVARSFYRRLGFEELELCKGYYQGVEDAIRMVKHLTP